MTLIRNVNIKSSDSASIDAFGRWRTSNTETVFDFKNIFYDSDIPLSQENKPVFWDNQETSGSGTSTSYRQNEASQRISVSNLTAGKRTRQTKNMFNYQPGKSQLSFITFNLISLDNEITKRVGYFNDNNGIFLETIGSDKYFIRRTYTSGSAINNRVISSSWNIDPMDGSGPSKISLDFTKTQILIIDFEWLGVGRVRVGFVVNGNIYYAHQFLNANNLTLVYMSTPNLPIRYEIENSGLGSASNLDCICSSVMSEGGIQDIGVIRYASTSTLVDASVAGTIYAVLGIRLKQNYLSSTVKIISYSLIEVQGGKNLEWLLIFNPTVAGAFTYADESRGSVQVARGALANTVSGGIVIGGGFFNSDKGNTGGSINQGVQSSLYLGSTISGTSDQIVLCVKPLAGVINSDVYGGLTWRELI